jgi:hypothetical protein
MNFQFWSAVGAASIPIGFTTKGLGLSSPEKMLANECRQMVKLSDSGIFL